MRQAELAEVGRWMARHGLADAAPTPLIAARLAVRWRARIVDSVLLAVFLCGTALAYALGLGADGTPLPVLAALVAGLLAGQWTIGWWVRRADRRAAAGLSRRVAHPVQLGWAAVLGVPYAVFAVTAFTAAFVLAVSVLPVGGGTLRDGALIVLIGLVGGAVGTVLQLRQVLTTPAVAEDETSLTADVIMRVEDARALITPTLAWYLPATFLYGESLGWWNAVAVALIVVGAAALILINLRSADVGTAARRAMVVR